MPGAILPRLVEAWEGVRGWARVILAPARLTRQEPLGSLKNSHFANAKPRFLRPAAAIHCIYSLKIPEHPLWRDFTVQSGHRQIPVESPGCLC